MRQILGRHPSAKLKVLVIWSLILAKDSRLAAEKASGFLPDPRVQHFWDAGRFVSRAYTTQFNFPKGRVAWDLFVAYKAGIAWRQPLEPTFWLLNLDLPIGTKYTPELLEKKLAPMLGIKN